MKQDKFQGLVLRGAPGEDIEDAARRAWAAKFTAGPVAMEWNDKVLYTRPNEDASEDALIERWTVEVTGKTPAERKAAMEALHAEHRAATERMKAREKAWDSGAEPKPWDEWYKKAKTQTSKTIGAFIDEVMSYDHDYNTVVYGVAACAVAAAWAANSHPKNGGITGFQSSFIMWEFIKEWAGKKGAMRLVEYEQLLYPQYDYRFEKEIPRRTAEWLVEEAKKKLAKGGGMNERVFDHMMKIAKGQLPFGFTISDER